MVERTRQPARPLTLAIVWLSIVIGVAFPPLWLIPIGIGLWVWGRRVHHNRTVRNYRRQKQEEDAAYGRRMRGY